jgi:hypothetical protein
MKDTAEGTGVVLTQSGWAAAYCGVLDDKRYNDRQDAKRRLQELYNNPPKRGAHKLQVVGTTTEDN